MYGSRQDKGHLTESGGDYISNFDRMTHHNSVGHVPSNRRRRDDLPKDQNVSFPALQSGGGTVGQMKRSVDHHMIGNRSKNSIRAHKPHPSQPIASKHGMSQGRGSKQIKLDLTAESSGKSSL